MTAPVPDPIREGIARGWKVVDASKPGADLALDCDVAVIGSGAGGGIAAEILALAGLAVVVVEEGPLRSSSDFRMREADAYPDLYQESAARKTADKSINILQGRCVGGGTTVNWTSSFRTPSRTLEHWTRVHRVPDCSPQAMAPWFERMEQRLEIGPWSMPPNANNAALARGADAVGIPWGTIRRNVRGCADLGYCGVGCPLNAKLSTLVTALPVALDRGATLVTRMRAERLVHERSRVVALEGHGMDASGTMPGTRRIVVRARAFVSAAGAIGTPALLLRSLVPDPHALIGKRTFLHPVVVSAAVMPQRIDGFAGAPQTVYSDHYLDSLPLDGPIGFKLEAPPVHPILAAITLPGHGAAHARVMRDFAHLHVQLALLRDGFHPESPGGTVRLRDDGTPVLDYPLSPYLWEGVRRAMQAMAELQFAAGATQVMPIHGAGTTFANAADARKGIAAFGLAPLVTPLVSAHVMGGCPMGGDPKTSVVTPAGRHRELDNLLVADGSLFPTSIGANPQLSIFAFAARVAEGLAKTLRA
ncbi:MAG TPA: GMC family oxidoreductase [Casimicrobiaceae bacterium]|nr:GMC family oxidoreductase [Casimicrobiaceae bacterium]